ncbi:hypothetical protein DJ69_08120 [Halorubrum persicum]|uniref:Uncharacterized protein n=1 Tax=Halorubrum persicum TaxID=1383844 RepID=A0A2G1WJ98_9EURY|nr:hypothetical protein [Halorubrum persicum]PHQ39074.1 hypothetical protein DJ69_08120 [Halorubrum persicum]
METRRTAGPSAYRLLVECEGSPFAPSSATKPVADVLAGRRTNDAIDAGAWLDALAAARGTVAIYFGLPADHEWWLAYDDTADDESAYHRWYTYPSARWTHETAPRRILEQSLADLDIGRGDDSTTIYRSRIVPTRDAPEYVRERVKPAQVCDTGIGIEIGTDTDTAHGTENDTVPAEHDDSMDAGESV